MLYDKAVSDLKPMEKINKGDRIFELLKQSIPILMGIFLFFNPFPHTTTIKEVCFYLSAFIVLLLLVFKKVIFSFKTPLSMPFALFTIWVFVGLFFALDKAGSLHDFYAHLLKYMAIFYIIVNFYNSKERLITLSWIIIISGTVFSIGGIYHFYVLQGNPLLTKFTPCLPEIPVNLIGITTITATMFALHHFFGEKHLYGRIVSLICLIPLYVMTFLTQARATLMAMIIASVVLLFKKKKVLIACLGITLTIAGANPVIRSRLINANLITSLRMDINYVTFEIIKDFPVMGIGFGMETYRSSIDLTAYNERVPVKYRHTPPYNDPHGMLPNIAVRTGLLGLVLFLNILFAFSRMCWGNISRGKDEFIKSWGRCVASVFVAVFIIGIFEPILSHHPESVFYTILAMMTILWRLNMESA